MADEAREKAFPHDDIVLRAGSFVIVNIRVTANVSDKGGAKLVYFHSLVLPFFLPSSFTFFAIRYRANVLSEVSFSSSELSSVEMNLFLSFFRSSQQIVLASVELEEY